MVQISSDLSERKFLGTSRRPLSVALPVAVEPKPGACGRISETITRQKLSPLIDRLVLVDPVGIKIGGREERDIVHFFNTSPDELN